MRVDCAEGEPLGSPRLQEVYGRGYFHGANSGFASEGYGKVHATWKHWMPWVAREVGAGGRWLDLGCAYGFLVAEAREAGRLLRFKSRRTRVVEAGGGGETKPGYWPIGQ